MSVLILLLRELCLIDFLLFYYLDYATPLLAMAAMRTIFALCVKQASGYNYPPSLACGARPCSVGPPLGFCSSKHCDGQATNATRQQNWNRRQQLHSPSPCGYCCLHPPLQRAQVPTWPLWYAAVVWVGNGACQSRRLSATSAPSRVGASVNVALTIPSAAAGASFRWSVEG